MRSSVVVFPGSNCDRDVAVALSACCGMQPTMVWHGETDLPPSDLVVLPGGFSHGDYLRAGAIAARAPVMHEVVRLAGHGVPVLGICNGFQILTESGLLPGALLRNAKLRFVCKSVHLRIEGRSLFTNAYTPNEIVRFPVAHAEGNYRADAETLARLEGEGHIAFRYCAADGTFGSDANPNGSLADIAGITSQNGRILGLMPHPERAIEPAHGGTDGRRLFEAIAGALS